MVSGKVDDPNLTKKYRKKNYRKNDKNGVSHKVKEEWLITNQNVIAVTEEMTGGKKKKHRNEEWCNDEWCNDEWCNDKCREAIKKNTFARQTKINRYKNK
jgi:hypothetical protein